MWNKGQTHPFLTLSKLHQIGQNVLARSLKTDMTHTCFETFSVSQFVRFAFTSNQPLKTFMNIIWAFMLFSYIECLHFTLLPLKSPYPSKAKHGDTIRWRVVMPHSEPQKGWESHLYHRWESYLCHRWDSHPSRGSETPFFTVYLPPFLSRTHV